MQLFPSEIAEFSHEQVIVRHSHKFPVVYVAALIAVILALSALPFIHVPVQINQAGIVRPAVENVEVKAPLNGYIQTLFVKLNQDIQQGDELFIISSPQWAEQEARLEKEQADQQQLIDDLQQLVRTIEQSAFLPVQNLRTPKLYDSYALFKQKVNKYNSDYIAAKKVFDRAKGLHETGVIAKAEFEEANYKLDQATAAFKTMVSSQLEQWQLQLFDYRQQAERLTYELQELETKSKEGVITSPLTGSVSNLAALQPNSFVVANQTLAQISPDTTTLVQCFINPKDVGYLYPGMPVNIRVDAFNYNQWGTVAGKVIEIGKDIQLVDNQPVFLVNCSLAATKLKMQEGIAGTIKKGMTCQVDFQLKERSLFNLLYDQADDWLNPSL
jgi:HlyD family secretion protein